MLVKGPGLMCEGLKTEGSGYPGAQCLLQSGKCRDWPPPLVSLLHSGPRALLLGFHLGLVV